MAVRALRGRTAGIDNKRRYLLVRAARTEVSADPELARVERRGRLTGVVERAVLGWRQPVAARPVPLRRDEHGHERGLLRPRGDDPQIRFLNRGGLPQDERAEDPARLCLEAAHPAAVAGGAHVAHRGLERAASTEGPGQAIEPARLIGDRAVIEADALQPGREHVLLGLGPRAPAEHAHAHRDGG